MGNKLTSNRRQGLSLVEILIAISIVGVLVVLVFPAANRIRKSANRSGDLANMHKISLAVQQFQLDHYDDGRIFLANDDYADRYGLGYQAWLRLLRPYLGVEMIDYYRSVSAYISPGDPTRGGATSFLKDPIYSDWRRSYSFNVKTLDTYQNTYTWRKSQILSPSRFLLFVNHRGPEVGSVWIDPDQDVSLKGIPDNWFDNGMANFAFLDGHAESIKVSDVMPGGSRNAIFYPEFVLP